MYIKTSTPTCKKNQNTKKNSYQNTRTTTVSPKIGDIHHIGNLVINLEFFSGIYTTWEPLRSLVAQIILALKVYINYTELIFVYKEERISIGFLNTGMKSLQIKLALNKLFRMGCKTKRLTITLSPRKLRLECKTIK